MLRLMRPIYASRDPSTAKATLLVRRYSCTRRARCIVMRLQVQSRQKARDDLTSPTTMDMARENAGSMGEVYDGTTQRTSTAPSLLPCWRL